MKLSFISLLNCCLILMVAVLALSFLSSPSHPVVAATNQAFQPCPLSEGSCENPGGPCIGANGGLCGISQTPTYSNWSIGIIIAIVGTVLFITGLVIVLNHKYFKLANKTSTLKLLYLLALAVSMGITGHLLNLYQIRPALDGNNLSKPVNLILINLALIPAVVVFVLGLLNSLRAKKYALFTLNFLGFILMLLIIVYFSFPIIYPSFGI